MKFSSGKPVPNAKMASRPMFAPLASGQPTPPGGARARGTMAAQPSGADKPSPKVESVGMTVAKPPAPTGPHISQEIRSELGKLTPELAAGIRRVAGTK
jgi:hypothetical protein